VFRHVVDPQRSLPGHHLDRRCLRRRIERRGGASAISGQAGLHAANPIARGHVGDRQLAFSARYRVQHHVGRAVTRWIGLQLGGVLRAVRACRRRCGLATDRPHDVYRPRRTVRIGAAVAVAGRAIGRAVIRIVALAAAADAADCRQQRQRHGSHATRLSADVDAFASKPRQRTPR